MINLDTLPKKLLINNEWVDATGGKTMPIFSPINGKQIAEVANASKEDAQTAYEAADAAFPAWSQLNVRQRCEYVKKFMEGIAAQGERLAQIDTVDSGNVIKGMRRDIDNILDRIERSMHYAANIQGMTSDVTTKNNLHFTQYVPYGVVVRIVPFNHPVLFAATKIIPPLLMGNTVILKPSDYTPLSALALGEIIKEVFPPGVVNVLTGDYVSGDALVRHPKIKRIAFTGSTATAKKIMVAGSEAAIKNFSMELGGKNPMIIYPDADLNKAVKHAHIGMGYGSVTGQSCGSTTRIFVHEDVYDEYVEKLTEATKQLKVGNPLDETTDIGPVVSKQQMERILKYADIAKSEGATIAAGGYQVVDETCKDGSFVSPTLITNVDNTMRIAQEEVFGPVTCVLKWSDEEQMLQEANDIEYGLTASIWTNDLNKAIQTVSKVRAGYVWVNDTTRHYDGMPFGGLNNSGTGREESVGEMLSYCEEKSVHIITE